MISRTKRCAIYARFSDAELQSESSIDDQVRVCQKRAEALGFAVAEVYADAGISGAHAVNRPALQRLLADAGRGGFEVVLSEALDRMARSLKDTAAIYEHLQHHRIKLITLSEGEVSDLHIGVMGTMNALYLRELANKVRRGQAGRAANGLVPSGLGYGYDVVREFGRDGNPKRGLRKINPEQADVIRRIFAEYAAGRTARDIAHRLNADGVPSPTGKHWRGSTIAGNRARASGILWNQAYIGFIVWNRVAMVKDPANGKRVSRPNPPDEWIVIEAPQLRIVDDATWNAVQAVKARFSGRTHGRKKTKRLLAGITRCGVCGGAIATVKGGHVGCVTRREAGPAACTNNKYLPSGRIEEIVIGALRKELLSPARVREFMTAWRAERAQIRRDRIKSEVNDKRAIAAVERKIKNLLDLAENGHAPATICARLEELEAQRKTLQAAVEPDTGGADIVEFHPGLEDVYARKIDQLTAALNGDDAERAEAQTILRSIIAAVMVTPNEKTGDVTVEIHGAIPGILNLAQANDPSAARSGTMVAGGGLEPPTSAL